MFTSSKTFRSSAGPRFAGEGLLYPYPCPAKLTYKYNSMLTYILVSFLFGFVFFQKLCSSYG